MPSVAEIIGLKTPTPTPLDTAGIRAQWPQRLREQALFSARMTLQGYLDRVQTVLMQVADGTLDASAARLALTDKLAELGYSPEPGTAGTLRDARTLARLNLVLKTNRQTAASLAQLAESEDPQVAALFPAWELASGGYRKHHRTDWPQRWKAAGERVAWRGAHRTKMVALKSSPIWQALGDGAGGFRDTLGNPYPPFAFGSSYEWVPVDRLEARELGLLDGANGESRMVNRAASRDGQAEGAWGEAPPRDDSRFTIHDSRRTARRAAALLITALAVKAIRNKNEIDHCPKDGTILTKKGKCNSSRHKAGDKPAKDEAKEDVKQNPEPKHDGVKEDVKQWQEKPGRGQTLSDMACTLTEGLTFLRANAQTQDRDGKTVTWPERLVKKYQDGEGRKQGPDPRRLTLTKAAVATVRYPERIGRDYRGNQSFYYREFGGEAVAVFVDNATREVNGFMRGTVGQVRHSIGGKYFRRGK